MTVMTLSKALNAGLRKALEDDPRVLIMGEDVGKLRRVPGQTDGCRGLRREPGGRHPAGRVRIIGTAIWARPARLPASLRDPVRRVSCSRPSTRIVSQLAKMRLRSLAT